MASAQGNNDGAPTASAGAKRWNSDAKREFGFGDLSSLDRNTAKKLFNALAKAEEGQQHLGSHLTPQQLRGLRNAGATGRASILRPGKPTGNIAPPIWLTRTVATLLKDGLPVAKRFKQQHPKMFEELVNGRTTDSSLIQSADSAASQCTVACVEKIISFEQIVEGRLAQGTADTLSSAVVDYAKLYVYASGRYTSVQMKSQFRLIKKRLASVNTFLENYFTNADAKRRRIVVSTEVKRTPTVPRSRTPRRRTPHSLRRTSRRRAARRSGGRQTSPPSTLS